MPSSPRHYPALDGLRAVAIAMVLLLHGARSFAPGGFLGVDLFFTLSGFVITSVLLHDHGRQGQIRLSQFWLRRARRLLPAFALLLVLTLVLWRGIPEPKPAYGPAAIAAAAYVANVQAMLDPAELGALVHTWSLSTEEQFYLLWPPLLVWLLTLRRELAVRLVLCIIVVAALARAYLRGEGSVLANYYSPLLRVDELLAGCALALIPRAVLTPYRRGYRACAWLFVACWPWLLSTLSYDCQDLHAGGYTLFALGCMALLSVAIDDAPSLLGRVLSLRWLVALGKRSYGIYLYHLPIFMWFEQLRDPGHPLNFVWVSGLRLACTLLVAELSYRYVERPILARSAATPVSARKYEEQPSLPPPSSQA
jgi:peptidoglycan/LPS O-acetylase OafA/YrhL